MAREATPKANAKPSPDASTGAVGDAEVGDLTRQGFEHLQSAARELIRAARSFLDVAEELVDDPDTVVTAVSSIGALVQAAGRGLVPAPGASEDGGGEEPRVQRIRVS